MKPEIINFANETLWPGNIGHLFVVIAFFAALFSSVVYFFNAKTSNSQQIKWANLANKIHLVAVIGVFTTLFFIIFKHYFEYHYAWRHSSTTLPLKYMISCFWEGQEGSFLLWMFWTAVISVILIRKPNKFTYGVLAIVTFTNVVLGSMLLGIEIPYFEFTIGSSPFDLLRVKSPEILDIPVLAAQGKANYLEIYKEGNGLNQLLQNPWMVIHPPTLFAGFAIAVVPFAYSLTALWIDDKRSWMSYALYWSLLCVGILGVGIMMGGWWAYESLSFGGYWAWDPVENASLLPWLIMVSALHLILISRATGRQLFGSHFLIQLSFILVLYATFLTRSGILGEASVHSFTDLGLSGQLLVFLFSFIWISIWVLIDSSKIRKYIQWALPAYVLLLILINYFSGGNQTVALIIKWLNFAILISAIFFYIRLLNNKTHTTQEEEKWLSREFWMLIGSMVLILSLIQVISSTSIPIINKFFGSNMAVPNADKYNSIQLWMAMPIMAIMAIGQWFKYRNTPVSELKQPLLISFLVSVLITAALMVFWQFNFIGYVLFALFSIWLIVANTLFYFKTKKVGIMRSGASIAHAGFGVLLLGIIVSSVNKKVLTETQGSKIISELGDDGKPDEKAADFNRQNRMIVKNKPEPINQYTIDYYNDTTMGENGMDKLFYLKFAGDNENFELAPKVQNNPKMGLLAEPSTKHFLSKDIFTHVNYESGQDKPEPYAQFKDVNVSQGESFLSSSGKIMCQVKSLSKAEDFDGIAVRIAILATRLNDSAMLYPVFVVDSKTAQTQSIPAQNEKLGVILSVNSIIPNGNKASFNVNIGEKEPVKQYIVLKVIEFPWINLVWAGTILVGLGFGIAAFNRLKELKLSTK